LASRQDALFTGYWVPVIGFRLLGSGYWVPVIGFRLLGSGYWVPVIDCGLLFMGREMTVDMRDVLARKMQNADLPRILQLLADDELGQLRETLETTPHDDYQRAFTAIDADPNQYLAVFEKDNNIIGCLQISFIPGLSRRGALRGQIESVRVAANVRCNGYGTIMMAWAIEKCREQGCSLVQLTSDKTRKDAQRFYQELGFVPSHEGFKLLF
jgi:ribosomal protein S18 acetylase RimI-like enzyme